MNQPLLEHDQRTSFADDWDMSGLEQDDYGIESPVDDDIYDGSDDAGIFGTDDSTSGGGGTPLTLSVCIAGTPTSVTFLTVP